MGHTPTHIAELLDKYVNNVASPEEVRELFAYFREETDDRMEELVGHQLERSATDAGHLDPTAHRLLAERLARLTKKIAHTTTVRQMISRRWLGRKSMAITVLILVSLLSGLAGYYFYNGRTAQRTRIAELDIQPGSNRATLLLADGSEFELDGGKQGIVVGESITYDDGTLVPISRLDHAGNSPPPVVTLVTPRGGQYRAVLPDGTQVWLNANTSLMYPIKFTGDSREVILKGEAYFDVAHDHKQPFRVSMNETTIEVLGTEFNANGYEAVTATLIEGSVKIIHENNQRLLSPGEEAEVHGDIRVYPADVEKAVAWKNGFFYFKDDRITEILSQISRWYDVDVVYRQGAIPQEGYNGNIRREANLSEVLEMLNYISGAEFKVNGKEVSVTF